MDEDIPRKNRTEVQNKKIYLLKAKMKKKSEIEERMVQKRGKQGDGIP